MTETHFPSPLRLARLTRGWLQSDLAAQSGVSTDTISRVERGGLPTLTIAQALARALDSTLDELFPNAVTPAENGRHGTTCAVSGDASAT